MKCLSINILVPGAILDDRFISPVFGLANSNYQLWCKLQFVSKTMRQQVRQGSRISLKFQEPPENGKKLNRKWNEKQKLNALKCEFVFWAWPGHKMKNPLDADIRPKKRAENWKLIMIVACGGLRCNAHKPQKYRGCTAKKKWYTILKWNTLWGIYYDLSFFECTRWEKKSLGNNWRLRNQNWFGRGTGFSGEY